RLAYSVLAEPGPSGPITPQLPQSAAQLSVHGLRFVVLDDDGGSPALTQTIEMLLAHGARRVTAPPLPAVPMPGELEPGVWAYAGDHYAAAESLRPGFWERHGHQLTPYAQPIYDGGRHALAWQYRQALNEALDYARAVKSWFEEFDLVVSAL